MKPTWSSFVLLLATLSAVPVQEVTSASYNAPLKTNRGKARRQASAENVVPQVTSPCPEVLSNIRVSRGRGQWSGIVSINPSEAATGAVLDIELDKRSHLIGTSFGEVTTNDNIIHTIRNDEMNAEAGQMFLIQFFVKYDRDSTDPPNVKSLRFNGRQICPLEDAAPETVPPLPATTTTTTTTTSPPPLPTISAPLVSERPRALPTIPSAITPPRHSPGESNRQLTSTKFYEVDGEFKFKSNASLLVLLIARPREENLADGPQTESLEDLLQQVFGDGTNLKGQVLRNRDSAGDSTEDDPPFTSSAGSSSGDQEGPTVADSTATDTAQATQLTSPCPGVFAYLPNSSDGDMWYGSLDLTAEEDIFGIRLDIELDRPARFLGALLGEVSSLDNIRFTFTNFSADIKSGETVNVRIFAKYDRDGVEPPRIRRIRLNGRQICPARSMNLS